jgi:hypothetical protein
MSMSVADSTCLGLAIRTAHSVAGDAHRKVRVSVADIQDGVAVVASRAPVQATLVAAVSRHRVRATLVVAAVVVDIPAVEAGVIDLAGLLPRLFR